MLLSWTVVVVCVITFGLMTKYKKIEGFTVRDESVWSKLERYRAAGPDKLHVILDFDHTLTAGIVPGKNVGTFQLLHDELPEEAKSVHDELYNKYRPIEAAHQLTEKMSERWYIEALDILATSGINIKLAKDAMLKTIKARQGSSDLFKTSHESGVPIVVLSAGVKQMIQMILEKYKLDPQLVLATEFIVRPDGEVHGWKKQTLIHTMNKHERSHAELSQLHHERPNVVVVGDELADAAMVSGDALRIRVFDPRIGETVNEAQYEKESFAAGFDLIVKYSLEPVAQLVGHIASPASRIQ